MGRWRPRRLTASLPARFGQRFIADDCPNLAVLIAWNLMFAAFPIVILVAGILGFMLRLDRTVAGARNVPTGVQVRQDLLALIPGLRPDEVITPLRHAGGPLLLVGILGLLWTGAGLFGAMETAFCRVYRVKPRPFPKAKLMAFAMILLFAPMAGLIIGSASLLGGLAALPFFPTALQTALGPTVQVAFGALCGGALFAVIYRVVPNIPHGWRDVLPGALLAGALMETLTLAFPAYERLQRGFNRFGSSFALLFLLLTFFYFLGLLAMAGAELNAILRERRAG